MQTPSIDITVRNGLGVVIARNGACTSQSLNIIVGYRLGIKLTVRLSDAVIRSLVTTREILYSYTHKLNFKILIKTRFSFLC